MRAAVFHGAGDVRIEAVAAPGDPGPGEGSAYRGAFAAVVFVVILLVLFKRPLAISLIFGAFMLVFYIPTGYYIDMTMWRKRERQRIRDREGNP